MKIWFVVLTAWNLAGLPAEGAGVYYFSGPTARADCLVKELKFRAVYGVPHEPCQDKTVEVFKAALKDTTVTFDHGE